MRKANFLFYTLLSLIPAHLIHAEQADYFIEKKMTDQAPLIKVTAPVFSEISSDKNKNTSFSDDNMHENHDKEEVERVEIEEESSEDNEIPQEEVIAALRAEEDKKKVKDDLAGSKKKEVEHTKVNKYNLKDYATATKESTIHYKSSSDFIKKIIIEYQNGNFDEFLSDIDEIYLDSTEQFSHQKVTRETALTLHMNKKLPVYKKEFQNILQYFITFHPSSSITKTLTYKLAGRDQISLIYIPLRLEKTAKNMVGRGNESFNVWSEILENLSSYTAKRQLLDSGKLVDISSAHNIKRLNLALDLAQQSDLNILTASIPSIKKRIDRHYQVYYNSLEHGYRTQDLVNLIDGKREPTTYEENLLAEYAETLFWIEDQRKDWNR
jgi:hypothetical protein